MAPTKHKTRPPPFPTPIQWTSPLQEHIKEKGWGQFNLDCVSVVERKATYSATPHRTWRQKEKVDPPTIPALPSLNQRNLIWQRLKHWNIDWQRWNQELARRQMRWAGYTSQYIGVIDLVQILKWLAGWCSRGNQCVLGKTLINFWSPGVCSNFVGKANEKLPLTWPGSFWFNCKNHPSKVFQSRSSNFTLLCFHP